MFMPRSVHWSCMCCISDPFGLKICSFSVLCACKSGLAQPQAKTLAVFIVHRNVPREESEVSQVLPLDSQCLKSFFFNASFDCIFIKPRIQLYSKGEEECKFSFFLRTTLNLCRHQKTNFHYLASFIIYVFKSYCFSLLFSYLFLTVPVHRNHLNTHYCIMCCPCVVVRDQSDCETLFFFNVLPILLEAATNVLVPAGSKCLQLSLKEYVPLSFLLPSLEKTAHLQQFQMLTPFFAKEESIIETILSKSIL